MAAGTTIDSRCKSAYTELYSQQDSGAKTTMDHRETDLAAFARAVRLQSDWIRDYIERGQLNQAKECAYSIALHADRMLGITEHQPTHPDTPENGIETPLHLLNSAKTQEFARAIRHAAECAQAVDAERGLPCEGSMGQYLDSLACGIEEEVLGPKGLRSLE